jgi:hypothetical protein
MKKAIVICLIGCFLANALPKGYVHAFFKIANLFEHYKVHQHKGHEHNFLDFLADHYFGEHHEDDHNSHENLPLHNPDTSIPLQLMPCLLPQQVIAESVEKYTSPIKKSRIVSAQSEIYICYYNDIWQPPRA